jgi:hypothetical protein
MATSEPFNLASTGDLISMGLFTTVLVLQRMTMAQCLKI